VGNEGFIVLTVSLGVRPPESGSMQCARHAYQLMRSSRKSSIATRGAAPATALRTRALMRQLAQTGARGRTFGGPACAAGYFRL